MTGLQTKSNQQKLGCFGLLLKGFVGGRRGDVECKRIENGGFLIVGITGRKRRHGLLVGGCMICPVGVVFAKQHCEGVDIGAFAGVGGRCVRGSPEGGATGVKVIARARSGYGAAQGCSILST